MPTKAHIDSLCVPLHDNISVRAVKHFVLRHETTAAVFPRCLLRHSVTMVTIRQATVRGGVHV